ncbi:hypothetical protein [Acetobacterium sp.]|uniref:hypothetical protein n=1 Tax=Acetobacterium sp. TaxID=1872094 RepID=UPI00271D3037|nr:hypothetical protein [Acetobacterium sp.]MDO9492970.1 hypothetical protein [Acetobacterium sp.]
MDLTLIFLVIVEVAYVNPCGKGFINQIAIDHDGLVPGLKKQTDRFINYYPFWGGIRP